MTPQMRSTPAFARVLASKSAIVTMFSIFPLKVARWIVWHGVPLKLLQGGAGVEYVRRTRRSWPLDAGHFALESHGPEIAVIIRDFLAREKARPV